jgi:A/G-specific adenine glycosylase
MTVAAAKPRRKRNGAQHPAAHGARPRAVAADLLAWYDRHRRKLPWRAEPGVPADPYRVWLSEIMLQQTTVKAVAPYFARFLARWGDVHALAAAPLDDVLKLWAGLGYYARARNLHACARAVVERHGGRFPANAAELAGLPGIGPYTAAAIAAIAFDRPAAAVDGNVERVVARLFAVEAELPGAKPQLRQRAQTLVPRARAGDFAQALMDLGATICTPKRPACALCPWRAACMAHGRGDPERFPRKVKARVGRLRRGAAFVAMRADGAVLVRTRAATGLLGGMTEVPTTDWTHDFEEAAALAQAPCIALSRMASPRAAKAQPGWRRMPGVVTHVFTHFPLELVVFVTRVPAASIAPAGTRWSRAVELPGEAFPNLMRKVIAHALGPVLHRLGPRGPG